MITQRLFVKDIEKDKKDIIKSAEILKNGGIVAIPTETVYGLAANCYDVQAVENIFKAKGRPQDNPLIVHISSLDMLADLTDFVPEKAFQCAKKFWPGALTMVMPRSKNVPSSVSAGLETVAIRMPSDPVARAIINACGLPLAAPSANLSGSPSPTTGNHVLDDLDGKIDAVVMSEKSEVGLESTVITLTENPPRLLRPGGVTLEQLREVLPDIIVDKAVTSEPEKGKPVASPGMKYKHYAPKMKVVIVESDLNKFCKYVDEKSKSKRTCTLVFEGEQDLVNAKSIAYGKIDEPETQAQNLFSVLRNLDQLDFEICYARCPQKNGVGLAVYNRLIRAAAFEVIQL